MSIFDLLSLVWENLARRKGRVALTAVGVIIGTAAVVLLVSLGNGLQQNAASQLGGIGDLTKIQVWHNYGEFDPETGEPGAVFRVPGHELEVPQMEGGLHDFRWNHALYSGRQMYGEAFPEKVEVFLIEARNLDYGLEPGAEAKRGAQHVLAELRREIHAAG